MKETIIIGVLSSIIGAIVFAMISPLLKNIGKKIVEKLNDTNKNYSRNIYREAAKKDINSTISFYSSGLIIIISLALSTISVSWFFDSIDDIRRQNEKNIIELSELISPQEEDDQDKLLADLENIVESTKDISESIPMLTLYSYIILGIFALFMVSIYFKFIRLQFIRGIISNYEQEVAIKRPLISEFELIQLNSDWAKMESKENHEKILAKLEQFT